ncbi:MAG: hypothetical protein IKS52_11120 [Clostridia bacterium]|nr:hypothetical protein [Clostridia bacterium]MBR4443804.1 hypothetical protein [Clostridia bacterium]
MYILSEKLTDSITAISREAAIRSNNALAFEEFVAVPCFGQIVLRYALNRDYYTLDDLDQYESLLNRVAGEDFLCDFMGSVYRKAGVDYSGISQRLIGMNDRFINETIIPSSHSSGIKSDASYLLRIAGLDTSIPVWEIQAEADEYTLLLMGKENKSIMKITNPMRLSVGEVDERSCTGLLKGTIYCRRNHISLARILING